ncbi:uncharacterized protein LOC132714223 [Ruditapes philippinarum]|uniref:uncharacterized protein LOC132714223 n=1 Tax=Ruditapes philippinarum TaxID=129788 RepID=UPI00295B6E77|nr:uncharacterized protein LOC132714223 [Ruditapes philippinarum]
MASKVLADDLFNNWVRGVMGLEYFQEGLQEFVGDKVLQCRDKAVHQILLPLQLQQCNQCTSHNLSPEHLNSKKACSRSTCNQKSPQNCFGSKPGGRRKCPNGVCSKFYDAIIDDHVFNDPLWKNTDPSTWCSDPHGWGYGKCFQTTKSPGTSAKDTDAAGLLSIIINNKSMHNFVSGMNPLTASWFHMARDIRNKILHSSKLEVDEATLCSYLDVFITVLQDPKCLLNDNASKNAVDKLTQLKNNTIHITQGDTVSLLENRNKALTELDERTAESLRKLDEKAFAVWYDLKEDVVKLTKKALTEVEIAGTSVKETLSVEKNEGISDINIARASAERDIARKINHGLSDINTARAHSKEDIVEMTNDCLFEIKKAETEVLQNIMSERRLYIDEQKSDDIADFQTSVTQIKQDALSAIAKAVEKTGKEESVSWSAWTESLLKNGLRKFRCKAENSRPILDSKVIHAKQDHQENVTFNEQNPQHNPATQHNQEGAQQGTKQDVTHGLFADWISTLHGISNRCREESWKLFAGSLNIEYKTNTQNSRAWFTKRKRCKAV